MPDPFAPLIKIGEYRDMRIQAAPFPGKNQKISAKHEQSHWRTVAVMRNAVSRSKSILTLHCPRVEL